jgi:hypothetical protein
MAASKQYSGIVKRDKVPVVDAQRERWEIQVQLLILLLVH